MDERDRILIVNDFQRNNADLEEMAGSRYRCESVTNIQDAYWMYLENPSAYKLVLLDFNLVGNSPRSNFDGIDLALMIDTFAQYFAGDDPQIKTPWLVAFTAADELVESFMSFPTSSPLRTVIRKSGDLTEVFAQLSSLFRALEADAPDQFSANLGPIKPLKPRIYLDDVSLKQLDTYRKAGEKGLNRIGTGITKALFASYRHVTFSALAPGYSGSEVLSVIASRSDGDTDRRTFVIKLCDAKSRAGDKLSEEVKNYVHHAKHIRKHVPLLIGPFEFGKKRFIAYEFVSFLKAGIRTFADHLKTVLQGKEKREAMDLNTFGHVYFIFNEMLAGWHSVQSARDSPPDTQLLYQSRESFRENMKESKERVMELNGDLESALKSGVQKLSVKIPMAPNQVTLTNPFFVVDCLLTKSGESYLAHYLLDGLVHGDLHSGNILRSSDERTSEWKLIDFANVNESHHLAQDGTRLECDIKFQQAPDFDPLHRFALEVHLAKSLDGSMAGKLKDLFELKQWDRQWKKIPDYHVMEDQIMDIRKLTLARLMPNNRLEGYSPQMDYTVALLMQSLMFIKYKNANAVSSHAWFAACVAASLIDQYSAVQRRRQETTDSLGSIPIHPTTSRTSLALARGEHHR